MVYLNNRREEYEKTRCILGKHWIGYCADYKEDNCPKTCNYATKLEKETGEWKKKI